MAPRPDLINVRRVTAFMRTSLYVVPILTSWSRDCKPVGCDLSIEHSVLPGQRALKVEVERSTKCRIGPVVAYHAVDGTHASTVNELPSGRLLAEFFRDRGR